MGRGLEGFLRTSVKGLVGETAVVIAAKLLLPSDYSRFHNVTLRTPDGTTQIDHVFVSRFGVFVVETKNMGGWIYGSERNRRWTQVFPGVARSRFRILSGRTTGTSRRSRRRSRRSSCPPTPCGR